MRKKNSQPRVTRPEDAKAGKSPGTRDGTERKQAEVELARSSERSWQTLDSMMEGCMVIGFDWTYLYVNDTAARQALQKRENLIGRTMLEMYPGVEQSDVFARYRRAMEERISQRFEQSYTFADGTTRWYVFSVTPVPEGIFVLTLETTEQKQAELALQQARDTLEARVAERTLELDSANARLTGELAERKQAEQALEHARSELEVIAGELRQQNEELHHTQETQQASEERFRTLYSTMNEGMALHEIVRDRTGEAIDYRILEVNAAFERITGIARDKAVGALASVLYQAGELPYLEIYARVAETGKPEGFETDFSPMQKSFRISVFSPGQGMFATVFEDITERKRAEEALRRSEDRYRALFEQSPVAIAYAREGRTLYVNPAYLRMFGLLDVGDLRGHLLTEQIAPSRRAEIAERASRRTQGASAPSAYETVGLRKDGTEFPFFVELSQVILADGPATIAFFTDITERKQAEAEIQRRVGELRAANEELEQFNRLAVDRELRMVELKREVNDALRKAGQAPKYGADKGQGNVE